MSLRSRLTTAALATALALTGLACETRADDDGPVDVDTQTDVGDDTGTTGGDDNATTRNDGDAST